jgi:hypothetical protein
MKVDLTLDETDIKNACYYYIVNFLKLPLISDTKITAIHYETSEESNQHLCKVTASYHIP